MRRGCYLTTDFDERFTLTAAAEPGSVFNRWWGECQESGSSPTCPLEMLRETIMVAVFGAEGAPPAQGEPPIPDGPLAAAPPDCTVVGTPGTTCSSAAGKDVVCGLGGNDRLVGPGAPTSCAAAGNDVLEGGPGADRLDGGAGGDRLVGGPGGRTNSSPEPGATSCGRGTATDVVQGGGTDVDRLDRRDRVKVGRAAAVLGTRFEMKP